LVLSSSGSKMTEVILTDEEVDDLTLWRFEVLRDAGYDEGNAASIADSHIDKNYAVRLLEKGCDQATAMRILF
jgi:hypothetical protein